ncbi:MAG: hypothetical protein IKV79_00600 [Oscillospiraceae bacterium]|nr:hypothetical protein [Oscillospiraceae bacterium]
MIRAWRIIGTIILIIIVAGIVAGGIGLLTGASLDRMVENVFGGWEAVELIVNTLLEQVEGSLPQNIGVSFVG